MLSFIAGPHACIGRTMSIIEMKAVVASVIANFEFEPAYEGQLVPSLLDSYFHMLIAIYL